MNTAISYQNHVRHILNLTFFLSLENDIKKNNNIYLDLTQNFMIMYKNKAMKLEHNF